MLLCDALFVSPAFPSSAMGNGPDMLIRLMLKCATCLHKRGRAGFHMCVAGLENFNTDVLHSMALPFARL